MSGGQAELLARIARIEDSRGTQGQSLDDLGAMLSHREAAIRAAATRALGRQQDPRWLPLLFARRRDMAPSVRLEAINAIGQALQRYRAGTGTQTAADVLAAIDTLESTVRLAGSNAAQVGLAARTIGRLPYRDATSARVGESAILRLVAPGREAAEAPLPRLEGALHGLYAIARQRRSLGAPSPASLDVMRRATTRVSASDPAAAARSRRLAVLGLTAAGAMDLATVTASLRDADEQVRRLGVAAEASLSDTAARQTVVRAGLADRSALVRFEAVRAARSLAPVEGCRSLTDALGDANAHVVLAAIDGLSAACADRERVATRLLDLIDANRSDSRLRAAGRSGWHVHAHAMLALARTAPDRALPIVRREAREATVWTVRAWVARAATQLRDTATLAALARDGDPNVRAQALGGLATVAGHWADSLYLGALQASEHQVVMAGAQGLAGTPRGAAAVPALLASLERLTAERKENTRDPREAVLERLEELGDAGQASRLERWRTDFDSAIATRAAALVSKWTGRRLPPEPVALPLPREDIAPLMAGRWIARIDMSPSTGGGTFDVELFPREAPYTVARFVRLARAGWYNGLTFHRVEPAFVIQGGSPAANEYMGDGPFLRDELGMRSHTRGSLGISTRGRDTGDAQLFVNLADNFRLDHDYTVFGDIIRGRDVAERVLEADVIERVTILRR